MLQFDDRLMKVLLNCEVLNKGNRSRVQGFKVPFLSPDGIWDAYLREKRQLRQA